jgi:Holliday junction resolvase RusA-like endonuclease
MKKKGKKFVLFEKITDEPVIANPKINGKEYPVRGNLLWSQNANRFVRAKIKREIGGWFQDQFKLYISKDKMPQAPLSISVVYYPTSEEDLDNLDAIYRKCMLDSMQELGLIENDNPIYVRQLCVTHGGKGDNEMKITIKTYKE